MRPVIKIWFVLLTLVNGNIATSQHLLYTPPIENRSLNRFTIAGKVDDYFWVQKESRKRNNFRNTGEKLKEAQEFAVFDKHLQLIKTIPAFPISTNTLKKYLVTGSKSLDEIALLSEAAETTIILKRYAADGSSVTDSKQIGTFPFNEPGNSFLLAASDDKRRYLLLGFESVPAAAPRMHTIIFDEEWNEVSSKVYEHPFITQPFIQDDFFCRPASSFDNGPVQIANNGEWLMASASRINHNYLLFHFTENNTDITYKEIALPSLYTMEDVALSINNDRGEAIAGILSRYRNTANKNVHVLHYSFSKDNFDFDSSYRFSTLASIQSKDNNIVKENLIPVPGMGFMLLKEYGRTYKAWNDENNADQAWDIQFMIASNNFVTMPANYTIKENSYTRYASLAGMSKSYERGNLSLFYFPGHSGDSSWSGTINKKQVTELNAPTLSYLCVPIENNLVFLYNNIEASQDPYGFATTLDTKGNLVSEREVISWKADQSLVFQQAIRISNNEVAVPYVRDLQQGVAILKF